MCDTSCPVSCQPVCCAPSPCQDVCSVPSPCQASCCVPLSCKPVLYVPMHGKHIMCVIPSCQPSGCCQPCPALVCRPDPCSTPSCF
ncbi:keratin-associated protein 12-1-like [Ovis aries]|uniref:Uncharacterized protein n=1 Tax=Ovis aries TaxID=9940 RepID=A0A6P7DM79_SHEEP|nr:keratin-associated protein 12-1-like [Ovis aries]KAG5216313.1 hypothetical protein JEQ12_001889 [Ovis aries]